MSLEEPLRDGIREFNEYRVPEVEVRLLGSDGESFTVEFKGSFCETCGFYDYFDDFRIVLEDELGLRTEIAEVEEVPGGAIVKFILVVESI